MDDLPLGILSSAFKDQSWSNDDIKRQLTYGLLHGADWAQTRTIAKNPTQYHETNPLLGEHPSVGRVNNYFLTTLLGHALIANYLSPEYRKLFQNATIGLEAGVAGRNKFNVGIGMTF